MEKILLIHGWDYDNYYGRIQHSSWENRKKFLEALKKYYQIAAPDLPGFGLNKEPAVSKYTVEDYAQFIHHYIEENNFVPDYILGYSFGGAVAVTYQKLYNNSQKLLLISPALIRNFNHSKNFIKTPSFLEPIRNTLRNYYLIYKVKVPEMVYGTKFLRNTYQSIVREEMIQDVLNLPIENYIIVYGSLDTMVDPERMMQSVSPSVQARIYFIEGGGHDIANTHTLELVRIIRNYTEKQ